MYTHEKHEGPLFFMAHKLYGLFIWHFLNFCYISFEDVFFNICIFNLCSRFFSKILIMALSQNLYNKYHIA